MRDCVILYVCRAGTLDYAHIYTPYIYGAYIYIYIYIYTSYRKNLNKAFSRQICGNQTTRQRFGLSASNFLFFAFVVGGVLLFVQKRWCLSASHHHRTLFWGLGRSLGGIKNQPVNFQQVPTTPTLVLRRRAVFINKVQRFKKGLI